METPRLPRLQAVPQGQDHRIETQVVADHQLPPSLPGQGNQLERFGPGKRHRLFA